MELGLACTVCGQLNLIRAQTCSRCGNTLAPAPINLPSPAPSTSSAPPSPLTAPPAGLPAVPRFAAATGQALQHETAKAAPKTMFFGALQKEDITPRLVVIKGEGGD